MKIRTDFVTNSSSYTSACIVIDNPVLLEILQKYKDLGVFDNARPCFSIGSYKTRLEVTTPELSHLSGYEKASYETGEELTKNQRFSYTRRKMLHSMEALNRLMR